MIERFARHLVTALAISVTAVGCGGEPSVEAPTELVDDEESSSAALSGQCPSNPTTGVNSVLVLRVTNAGVGAPTCSAATISAALQSAAAFYSETSFGRHTLSAAAPVDVSINYGTFGCTDPSALNTIAARADSAATARGFNPANYSRVVYVLKKPSGCTVKGGSASARIFIMGDSTDVSGCHTGRLYAHEYGHTLGLNHASTYAQDYGDASDVMGNIAKYARLNGPHQAALGWSPQSVLPSGTYITTYTLTPLESGGRVLKLGALNYYASFRMATGASAALDAAFTGGVSLHFAEPCSSRPSPTYLETTLWDGADWQAGQVRIRQQRHSATSASITVTSVVPPAQCGIMPANQGLIAGNVLRSCDGRFNLQVQWDGNVVLYRGSTALWAANTNKTTSAIMQADGNFVGYDSGGSPTMATNTASHPGAHLVVQNDGNLVIYGAGGRVLWASGTAGR